MTASAKVLCPNCKLENRRGDPRCAGCGNALPRFAGLPRVATPALPPEEATPPAAPRRDTDETHQIDASEVQRVLAAGPPPPPATAGPAPTPEPEATAVAWLHCEPLPPIALVDEQEVTIGRKNCRLILAHTEVSRHHATIKVSEAAIAILDHGSSNGTYVNGKRVTQQVLRVGDLIKIGPYSLELWQVKDLPTEDPEVTGAVPLAVDSLFSGKLGAMNLAEVLDSIAARRRTGTLSVTDRQQRGLVRFADGRLLEAEWGRLRGDAAVKEMTKLGFGSFAFSEGAPSEG